MQISNNRNSTTAFILTLVFPFGGFIYTLSHWREKWAKNTFWLACIYMGVVFVYWPEGTVLGVGADGGRYVLRLMDMYNNSNVSISSILSNYLRDDGVTMDLYQPLITYLVSRFTDNGHVLFAVFALVFGFFYSRNIWYILKKLPRKKFGGLFILVALYFLICPITQINGVRMWTALHVFVYGMMPYIIERDKSKLWWVLLTPLIHFSYLYAAIFAMAYFLIPSKIKSKRGVLLFLAYAFFVVSLFVNALNLDAVNGMLEEYSPEAYESKINTYVNQNYSDTRSEAAALNNWYVAASGSIIHWSYSLLLLSFIPCLKRKFKNNTGLIRLYFFTLLIGGFANVMALIPSGGRFQLLSQMFSVPLLLLVVMNISNKEFFRKMVNVALFFLLIPLVFQIRKEIFDYYSITFLFGNFITIFFWENNVLLIDLIKQLL